MRRAALGMSAIAATTVLSWSTSGLAQSVPHRHDGFYLQLQAGFGYLSSTAKADIPGGGELKITYKGLALDSALLIGGSPIPGLAIGGMLLTDYVPGPKASSDGQSADLEDVNLYLVGIGPFVDFYPTPQKGLHFQAMFGYAAMEASYKGNAGGSDPVGVVMGLGGGYDWWVGNEASIGVMGRLIYAPLKRDEAKFNTVSPGVVATFTFN